MRVFRQGIPHNVILFKVNNYVSDQQNEDDEVSVCATEDSEDVSGEYVPMCMSVLCLCGGVYVVCCVYVRGILCVFCACMWMHACVSVCACICICV